MSSIGAYAVQMGQTPVWLSAVVLSQQVGSRLCIDDDSLEDSIVVGDFDCEVESDS